MSLKTKQNRLFQTNGFRSLLTPEAHSILNKLIFFDEHFESKSLRNLSQNVLAGHLSLYDLYASDEPETLEDLVSKIEYEVLDLSVDTLRLDFDTRARRTHRIVPKNYWSLEGGTIVIDYLLLLLRNPLFDPGQV